MKQKIKKYDKSLYNALCNICEKYHNRPDYDSKGYAKYLTERVLIIIEEETKLWKW